MADDKTTPDLTGTTDQANAASEALGKFTNAGGAAAESLSQLNILSGIAKKGMEAFGDSLNVVRTNLKGSGVDADRAAAQFSLLSTSLLGSRKAFEGISGISSSNLSGFNEQISILIDNMEINC